MYISVRVVPGAKKEQFKQKQEDAFHIAVKEEARQNRANTRVRTLLAEHFNISDGKVRIVSGHRSPKKIISIDID
jgi:uncharacterized protein YggU (UPF0235/DUF167 family)